VELRRYAYTDTVAHRHLDESI